MLLSLKSSLTELLQNEQITLCGNGDIVKANVDIKRKVVHIGKDVHADMESEMMSEGSERGYLVGINIFVDSLAKGEPIDMELVEFSSMINFDVNKMYLGDLRSGNMINDDSLKKTVMEVLCSWLVQ